MFIFDYILSSRFFMFSDNYRFSSSMSREEIIKIMNTNEFKDIFIRNNLTNVIVFGSLSKDEFTEESDIDIAIISKEKLPFDKELIITQKLEDILKREIDLIDINDENVNNLIKIEALNSRFIIISDNLLEEARNYYDKLAKENEEFWRILDREVLGIE